MLKRERIRRQIYTTRAQARSDVFDYIEMFYNPKRRHGYANQLSPEEFERQYFFEQQNRLENPGRFSPPNVLAHQSLQARA